MFRKRTFAELSSETTLRRGKMPLILFLHNIRSQYNVGAILRTADAVGVQKVVLSGYTPLPEQKGVKKTALRGLHGVLWEYVDEPVLEIQKYKKQGFMVYGLEQCHGSLLYDQVRYNFPAVLVLGEEVEGVDEQLLQYCDQVVEIPMFGQAHSLNVSVAAGIMLYHMRSSFST